VRCLLFSLTRQNLPFFILLYPSLPLVSLCGGRRCGGRMALWARCEHTDILRICTGRAVFVAVYAYGGSAVVRPLFTR